MWGVGEHWLCQEEVANSEEKEEDCGLDGYSWHRSSSKVDTEK